MAVGQGIGPLKGFSASFQTVVVLGAGHRVLCWNRRREQRRLARVLTQMSAREQRCHVITREGRPGHERAFDSADRLPVGGIRHEAARAIVGRVDSRPGLADESHRLRQVLTATHVVHVDRCLGGGGGIPTNPLNCGFGSRQLRTVRTTDTLESPFGQPP